MTAYKDPLVEQTMALYHSLPEQLPIGVRLETALSVARLTTNSPAPEAATEAAPEAAAAPKRRRVINRRPSVETRRFWEKCRPVFEGIRHLSATEAAEHLNENGFPTSRGGKWHSSTVWKLRDRLELHP